MYLKKIVPYLQLARPANIITAIADILCGIAVAMSFIDIHVVSNFPIQAIWLILATVGLYGGGVVFNDIFDRELDKTERPERPIPSGKIKLKFATIQGLILLTGGVFAAAMVGYLSLFIAISIAVFALVYDKWGKHIKILGPLNMGLCRGANVLLGASIFPIAVFEWWFIAIIPIIYISAITLIGLGEVNGKNRPSIIKGAGLYLIVIVLVFIISYISNNKILETVPFLILFLILVFPPLIKALQINKPANVKLAVRAGILSIIVLDASISTIFSGWISGLIVLCLLPFSIFASRLFAMT